MQAQNRVPFQVRKDHAVFTALFLIFLALLLSRVMPSLVPQDKPILELVVGGFFLTFSYSMVNALVGGAIDFAAEEKQRDFLDKQSPDSIHILQELEYYSIIPSDCRKQSIRLLNIQSSQTPDSIQRDSRIRDTIVCGLGDEKTLQALSAKACAVALRRKDKENFNADPIILRFCQDIYIYLQAWLILSIKYQWEMPIESIKQGYPNESSPNKGAYVRAIQYIKETLINKPALGDCLEEKYREEAKEILRQKLDKLIELLRNS